jgi:hypothetical protein
MALLSRRSLSPGPGPWKLLAVALITATAVAGCTLNRAALRNNGEALLESIGGGNTPVIQPKRCALTVKILPRPLKDPVINEALWTAADEQVVSPEARRALEVNGLRLGVITGGLPAALEAALDPRASDKERIEPAKFDQPDGEPALVMLADAAPTATVLINRDGRAIGKDYHDATGFFRIMPSQEGPTGVALRFVPEIHHGPVQRRFDAMPNGVGTPHAMQFMIEDGQQKETLRELAAGLTLQPGQVAVVGCLPDRPGSLGAFLFTKPEANSDRLTQKVVFVWADRTNVGTPGSQPGSGGRLEPVEPPDLATPAPKGSPRIDKGQR